MNTLKLESKNTAEARILEYLTANASDALAAKINAGTKTLADAMKYCEAQARKEAVNGVACVDAATVFGWAVHFFEEDNPTPAEADSDEPDGNTAEPDDEDGDGDDRTPAPVVSRKKQESAQAELDLFGGEADDE